MKTLITFITIAFSTLFVNAQMTAEKELQKTLDESTAIALKEHNVPGMAIAVFKNDQVIIKKGYGFSDIKSGETKAVCIDLIPD